LRLGGRGSGFLGGGLEVGETGEEVDWRLERWECGLLLGLGRQLVMMVDYPVLRMRRWELGTWEA
jgi:hypothetical protein